MSWMQDLQQLANDVTDSFATQIIHTPMMARPNERSRPDPSRPAYSLCGVYDETGVEWEKGKIEPKIISTDPFVVAPPDRFRFPPSIDDGIELPELGRRFTVRAVEFNGPHLKKLCLHEVGRPPMS